MEYLNSGISEEETLQVALQSGIIDINEISMRIEDMKRKEILSNHPYSIWYSETDNLWKTYLPDIENKNGRIFRKRKNKKDLEDLIVKYYISHQQEIYLKDVFTEWSESKLKYGEIQKQSYDRYCTDFQRFFPSAHPICRKKFKNITYPDLTDFIKSSIHEKHLTRKSYAGLRLLVRGIFKYGKSKGYTQLSMSEFFGDLELPNNIFEKKLTNKRKEVFSEEEIPILTSYLKHNIDIWNMGLLLQLQTGMRIGDDDDKIRLNQRKPSKYKGLSRFGPEKNLQRINKFMKERPIFYKNLIQMKENFRFYLRCFYCITKVVILQFNSEKQDRISS